MSSVPLIEELVVLLLCGQEAAFSYGGVLNVSAQSTSDQEFKNIVKETQRKKETRYGFFFMIFFNSLCTSAQLPFGHVCSTSGFIIRCRISVNPVELRWTSLDFIGRYDMNLTERCRALRLSQIATAPGPRRSADG
jgi:hypothetical protein